MKARVLSIFKSVCTALCVLTGSIAVPLLVRPFYYLHIGPLGLETASGLTSAQIREAYGQMMDYCLGLRSTFAVGVLPFSAEGASHFADVKVLFLLDLAVLALSGAALGLVKGLLIVCILIWLTKDVLLSFEAGSTSMLLPYFLSGPGQLLSMIFQ